MFETPDRANRAALTLFHLLMLKPGQRIPSGGPGLPAPDEPPESDWAETFGLDWAMYAAFAHDRLARMEPIYVYTWDRLVIMHNDHAGSHAEHETYRLLELLGAAVGSDFSYEGPVSALYVSVRCTAPDDETAGALYLAIHLYLLMPSLQRREEERPWGDHRATAWGHVLQLGRGLEIEVHFDAVELGLPALVDYLAAHGCVDFAYALAEGRPHRSTRREDPDDW